MGVIEERYIPSRQKTEAAELDAWIGTAPMPRLQIAPPEATKELATKLATSESPTISMTMTPKGAKPAEPSGPMGGMLGSNVPNVMADRLGEMGQSAISGIGTVLKAMFDPPIADRVINYLGGTPSNIPAEITRDLKAAGVDESLLPGLVPMIEGAIGQVHAMGPGKMPVTGSPEAAATREAAFQSPGRFNPARQSAPAKLTNLTAQINVNAREIGLMEEQTRGTVTLAETVTKARELIRTGKMSAERILSFEPGTILTAEEGTAARFIRDATHKHVSQIMQLAEAGDETAKSQMISAQYLASRIEAATEAASGTEPARALSARRILSKPKGVSTNDVIRMLQEGPLTPEAEQAVTKTAASIQDIVTQAAGQAKTPSAKRAVDRLVQEVDAAIQATPEPGQMLAGLWDTILRGTMRAEESAIDPDLLQMILTKTQHAINNAVPEGQLLGGLWENILQGVAKAEQSIDPDVFLAFWKHLTDNTQQEAFTKYIETTSRTGRWVNAFLEARAAGLLTLRSIERNLIGSGASTIWSIPERMATAVTGAVRGTNEGAYAHEAISMMHGIYNAQANALSMAGKALKTGESQFMPGATQVEQFLPAISADALNLHGPMGRFFDVMGEIIRWTFRGLTAGDDYFKYVNYEAEKYALGYREYRRLLKSGASEADAAKEYSALIKTPPEWLDQAAAEHSLYTTFNDEIINPAGKAIMAIRENDGPVGQLARFILPFARTPMNVMGYGAERTPGLNFLSSHYWQEIQAGGVRKDAAYARVALGSGVFGAFAVLAANSQITGKGPTDPKLKALYTQNGWKPYSIVLPGVGPISYLGFSPLSEIVGMAADYGELVNQGADDMTLGKMAVAMVISSAHVMEEYPMLKGLADILDAIRNQTRRSEGIIQEALKSILPVPGAQGIARTVAGVTDPYQRETRSPQGGAKLGGTAPMLGFLEREVKALWEEMAAATPWLQNYQYPKRDVMGRPMLRVGGWWTLAPTGPSAQEPHPVLDELVKHQVPVGLPAKAFGAGKQTIGVMDDESMDTQAVILSPKEWARFQELSGTVKMASGFPSPIGRTLEEELRRLIGSPEYQKEADGPAGGKAALLKDTFREYREQAKEDLIKELRIDGKPGLLEVLLDEKKRLQEFKTLTKAQQDLARPGLERQLGRPINIGILR